MCAIAGKFVLGHGEKISADLMTRMCRTLAHRGPDGEGYFIDGPVGLGHRRLAIIDLSETGAQPKFFENLSLIFNGEVYNYIELREELKKSGYVFDSQSDSEVLLKAYHC